MNEQSRILIKEVIVTIEDKDNKDVLAYVGKTEDNKYIVVSETSGTNVDGFKKENFYIENKKYVIKNTLKEAELEMHSFTCENLMNLGRFIECK